MRAGAGEPGVAAAHRGRRRRVDRDARIRRSQRQPRERRRRARDRHLRRRHRDRRPRRSRFRRARGRARRGRGGDPGHARRRACLPGTPAGVRGPAWEDLFERFDAITASGYSVSVFTRWGETVDQVWVKSRADELPRASRTCARSDRRDPAPPPDPRARSGQLHAPARHRRASGPSACPTSGWASRRAAARRSSPSSSSPGATPWLRSRPCAASRRRSGRWSWSARSGRSPPTRSG